VILIKSGKGQMKINNDNNNNTYPIYDWSPTNLSEFLIFLSVYPKNSIIKIGHSVTFTYYLCMSIL
jgi:hypothetical protein